MRILISFLAAALLAAPLTQPAMAKEVSIESFYETLDPYGDWIQTADYGFVWHPKGVDENWRPYADGSWAYTDAGWTWLSEEPYGAIVYHFGRWTRLQDTGWVWVPDTEWGPAWVSWRRSEQYVGWAPLPPEATFKRDVGISTWSDSYYDIGPTQYTFVASRDFGAPKLSTVILPRKQNVTIIRETKNITNITYSERGVFNEGPQYDIIVRDSRTPVRRLRLERREDVEFEGNRFRGDSMRSSIAGDSLRIFAPTISIRTEAAPTRVTRRVERVEVDRGWRDVPQAQELRATFQQDRPRVPASLPQQPAFTRATVSAPVGRTPAATENAGNPRTARDPRGNSPAGAGERPAASVTTAAPETKPGDRPPATAETTTRPEGNPPSGRKPTTAEIKNPRGQGRPLTTDGGTKPPGERPAATTTGTTEGTNPATTDAPRAGRGVPLTKTPATPATTAREGSKPEGTSRPEGTTKPEKATRPEGAPQARPPGTDSKPESPRGNKEARPDSERPGSRPEPKVSTPGGDAPRARPEGAPEGSKRPGATAPATRPAGATPAPEGKGKKGDKEKDKDKEKGQ